MSRRPMELWTRFAVTFGGLFMLVAGTMPWLEDVRPIQVPTRFLFGSLDDEGITGASFFGSIGVWFILASAAAVYGGLYGRRVLSWASGLFGFALLTLFLLQVLYQIGDLSTYAYGATVAAIGVAAVSIFGLWDRPSLAALFESPAEEIQLDAG